MKYLKELKMALILMNDYNDIEYCLIPDNPAVRMARKLMNKSCMQRIEQEDNEQNLTQKIVRRNSNAEKEYVMCVKCNSRGIREKYLKSEMLVIVRKTKRGKRIVTNKQHYCISCAETYMPQSSKVGCMTY
jgi:hypothetical protein